jgi:hypothetical protein
VSISYVVDLAPTGLDPSFAIFYFQKSLFPIGPPKQPTS